MKRIFYILLGLLFVMCSSPKAGTTVKIKKPEVQYRDDFTAAPDAQKKALLKDLNATGANYSVLIFTQNFKGEKVTATAAGKTVYSGNLISNYKSGIAEKIRIDNRHNVTVHDNFTKKDVVIEAADAQKHKFIYLMKNPKGKNAFTITYSNTLRPLD